MDAGAHTIAARASRDVAHGINRLNVCFAVGAVIGPLWAGSVLALDEGARALVYVAIALLAAGTAVVVATSPLPPEAHRTEGQAERPLSGMSTVAWVMGATLFLYVGAEFGLGSWVATYADEEFEAGIFLGGVISAGYWGALMVGRLVSGELFARAVPARAVLLGSIAVATATSASIALANDVFAVSVAAAFATGLAFGPVWPSAMAIAAEGRSSNAPAALVTIGNAGGFIFPWLQGRLLVSEGATTGIALSAVLCVAMLAVAWWGVGRRDGAR
jgi:fucose permease